MPKESASVNTQNCLHKMSGMSRTRGSCVCTAGSSESMWMPRPQSHTVTRSKWNSQLQGSFNSFLLQRWLFLIWNARAISEDRYDCPPSCTGAANKQTNWQTQKLTSSNFHWTERIRLLAKCSHSHLFAVHVWLKMEVSLKELQRMREWTLGDLWVYSANFWAKKPPKEAPKRWT